MTDAEEALALLRERNIDGALDNILDDVEAGRVRASVLRYSNQRALEIMKAENRLGLYNDLIALAERLMVEPLIVIQPGEAS